MKATELIGKMAIRIKPVDYENGVKDNSYTNEGIKIINATEHHIVFKHKMHSDDEFGILNYLWCDDSWVDYNELIDRKNKKQDGDIKNINFIDQEDKLIIDLSDTNGNINEIEISPNYESYKDSHGTDIFFIKTKSEECDNFTPLTIGEARRIIKYIKKAISAAESIKI